MNLLKTSFISSLLLCYHLALSNICVNTSSDYQMFGSVLRSGALVRGHELAFQDSGFSDYQFFSADSDVELEKQVEGMNAKTCPVLIGLYTSEDCLVAGPVLKKNDLIGISASSGHDSIKAFFPNLYSAVPRLSEFSIKIAEYLNKDKNTGKVIAIYQPTDIYSVTAFKEFKKSFKKPFITVSASSDAEINLRQFPYTAQEPVTLVFFSYPLPSAKILMDLSNHHLINKNVEIIGASSWAFDTSVFKPIKAILGSANQVLVTDLIDWKKVNNSTFTHRFKQQFNRKPLMIELLTYDTTRLAVECYRKADINNKNFNSTKFRNCLTQEPYHGISGTFSWTKQSPFAVRPLYLTNLLDLI